MIVRLHELVNIMLIFNDYLINSIDNIAYLP